MKAIIFECTTVCEDRSTHLFTCIEPTGQQETSRPASLEVQGVNGERVHVQRARLTYGL